MNPNNLVCRTCLGIISDGKVAHNIDEENGLIRNVRNIREMIMFCVPEMDVYISISPVICEPCIGILISVYNFKIRCLRVESAIRSYVTTNNVMEGSCVNLNNVVRQQIVEALRQKNWPTEEINEYLDKHLCNSKTSLDRPASSVFRVIAQRFNAPQLLNTTNMRAAVPNVFESPPTMNANLLGAPAGVTSLPPPPYPGTHQVVFRPPQRPPAPPGARFISVSKNLMPPPTERFSLNQTLQVVSAPNVPSEYFRPPVPPPAIQPQNKGNANMGDFQTTFLSALQLSSTAEGGREEAVLVNKTVRKKRAPRPSKKLVPPQPTSNMANHINPASLTLCPITGTFQKRVNQGIGTETGLRTIRKSMGSQVGNNKKAEVLKSDDIIILDDDPVVVTQRVGDELLLMNFDEHVPITDDVQSTGNPTAVNENAASVPIKPIAKQITVRLPKIDRETLRQKLTADDVIDEIQSKRRKLVVKLNPSLPYLHTNKRLAVKVARNQFFSCRFCKCTVLKEEALRTHYMSKHKVCSRCTFKTDRAPVLTQHINAMHPLDLKEALKKFEENKEFHCYLCNFTGLSEFDLRDHRLRVHIKNDISGLYKCPYLTCDIKNAIAYEISRHIEKNHDKLRKVQCPLCNYMAPTVSSLKKHIESHSLMKIKCHLCDLGFKTSFSLKLHVKKKHLDAENQSTSGMVFATELNRDGDHDDDYLITLDNLQSRHTELPGTTESSANTTSTPRSDQRNLDEYDFALPSLGEMLCAQTFIEEASDHEDCTIVSENGPPESHKRKRARPSSAKKKKTYIPKKQRKKTRKPEESCIDDPDDCMIVSQEIPIVDLSDEDEDDHEDCVLVSDVAESFTRISANNVDDSTASGRPDDSETDTCSELSVGATKMTPVSAVSGSETDTCSEMSAGDVLNQKTRPVEDLGNEETASDTVIGAENAITESGDKSQSVNVRLDASGEEQHDATKETSVILLSDSLAAQSASEKELLNKETPLEETMSVANEDVEVPEATESTTDSLKSAEQSVRSKCTSLILYNKDKCHLMLEEDSALISDKAQPNTSSGEVELENTKKLEDSSTISEPKSPQESQPPLESVVIDSSDEDSNDCTFVSATEARENIEEENKDANKNYEEENSERVEKGTLNKNEVSEVSKDVEAADLKKCQKHLNKEVAVRDKDDVLVTNDEVSEMEAQENMDIDKRGDKQDSEMVEKETLNEKESSDVSKSIEGSDIKKCQENLDKEVNVQDKGEFSNAEHVGEENKDTNKSDEEEDSEKRVEKGTLNKNEVSEVSKGIEAADLKECQEHLDKEVAVLVTNDEVSEIEAQGNIEEENMDIDKTDDKEDSEMVEKETLNKKEPSHVSKEGVDLKECQVFYEKIDIKDKDDGCVTSTEPVAGDDTLFSDSESENLEHTQTELDVEATQVKNHQTNSFVQLTEEKINDLLKSDSEMESDSNMGETSQNTNKDESDVLISDSQGESERSESSQNACGSKQSIPSESTGIDGKSLGGQKEDRLSKNEVHSEKNLWNNEANQKDTQVDIESTEKIEDTQRNVLSISEVTNTVPDSGTTGQHGVDGNDVTDDLLASSDSTVYIISSDKKDDANRIEINEHCSEEALSSVLISENVESQKPLNVEESTD